jgi:hypothetical protein
VSPRRSAVAFAAASLVLFAPSSATAAKPDARTCAAVRDGAQKLRSDKHLRQAREQLTTCSDAGCPADVRKACTKAAAEIDAAMPTVAFSAKDPSGAEVKALKVTLDGQPVPDADVSDGMLQVDPGQHTFTFSADPWAPVTRALTLAEGDRRTETVTFAKATGDAPAAETAPAPAPADETAPSAEGRGLSRETVGMVTGGLGFAGIAGLGLGGVFGMLAISARNQQTSDCASAAKCVNYPSALNDHSTSLSDGTISTAAFVVGGAFIAGAVGFYLLETHPSASSPATGVLVVPGPGGVLLKGEF